MSGNSVLLDTNVIIFASKQKLNFDALLANYDAFYVSVITYMEVYGFAFQNPEEKQLVDEFFENIEIIETDKLIADIFVNYRNTAKKKIKLPDAIILATAKYLEADLLTDDWDDFQEIDNKVVIKNIDPYKK